MNVLALLRRPPSLPLEASWSMERKCLQGNDLRRSWYAVWHCRVSSIFPIFRSQGLPKFSEFVNLGAESLGHHHPWRMFQIPEGPVFTGLPEKIDP